MNTEWDVIVVGAGTAGLPTALFAAARGASVLVVDSADSIGGTLHLSTGSFSAAGTRLQQEVGIGDSPEEHFKECLSITGNTGDPAIVRLWVDNAATTFDWLVEAGLDVSADLLSRGAPHELYATPRIVTPKRNGQAYLEVLEPLFMDAVEQGSITLLLNTTLDRLVHGEDGAVTGVSICSRDGTDTIVHGRNTVLSCGGFSADEDVWRAVHNRPHRTFPNPYAVGLGHSVAVQSGAHLTYADSYLPSFGGTRNVDDNTYGFHTVTMPKFRQPWELYVNDLGKRFMAEDETSPDQRERLLMAQPDEVFWCVYDQAMKESAPPLFMWSPDKIENAFASHPDYQIADTLRDLAKACDMDGETFVQTVEAYNHGQSEGNDPFGRKYLPLPLGSPPFYTVKHYGVSVLSFAGLKTDTELRIVDANGNPIPNLYAAGEMLGMGVFGNAYLGGAMVSSALTFGHLLGHKILL